jgi:cardiolipin synthase
MAQIFSAPTGSHLAQAIRSGAHNKNLDLMYLLAIPSAQKLRKSRTLTSSPDDLMRKELIDAVKRGVKVEVLVPGKKIDQKLVRLASRRQWPELIRAGGQDFRISTDDGAREVDDRG